MLNKDDVVYISGPMAGLPELNYPAFNAAATNLQSKGYTVENPADNVAPSNPSWENWMRLAIVQLMKCDACVLLPGWKNSKGARFERAICSRLCIPVYEYADVA